jgi:hypothetical protein
MDDSSVYNAISDRMDINEVIPKSLLLNNNTTSNISHFIFRGDCYLC